MGKKIEMVEEKLLESRKRERERKEKRESGREEIAVGEKRKEGTGGNWKDLVVRMRSLELERKKKRRKEEKKNVIVRGRERKN